MTLSDDITLQKTRLTRLREIIAESHADGLIIPRSDEYLGEYVPACAERLAWATGFTGSAGLAIILNDRACVFSDGRYITQMASQLDSSLWEQRHIIQQPPREWLQEAAPANAVIAYDPKVISQNALAALETPGLRFMPLDFNPVDRAWSDRPATPAGEAAPHPLKYAGEDSSAKRSRIAAAMRSTGQDAVILSDPTTIAWLLNIRGHDIDCTPVALCTAILKSDSTAELFIAPGKVNEALRHWLGSDVTIHAPQDMEKALHALTGKTVVLDPDGSPVWYEQKLKEADAVIVHAPDPCILPRALKNTTEQEGARAAHKRDAVAVCRFLHWLSTNAGTTTELDAAQQLDQFRKDDPSYREESFPAISAAGAHGAIMHYRVTQETNQPIGADTLFLIDSGGQYPDGTTDITRTVWTGPSAPPQHIREAWTRVLAGNLTLGATRFPRGINGSNLDVLARHALWQVGMDFDHGTGHGVGSYLSVHEGPVRIVRTPQKLALEPGMILSNEPGYYEPGEYGIRLETLELVKPSEAGSANRPFLEFETLTLVPFDRTMVEPDLLDDSTLGLLNAYHARVMREIGTLLPPEARAWLMHSCFPINRK